MQAEPTTKVKVKYPGEREFDLIRQPAEKPEELLQQLFDQFNDGSRHECEEFKACPQCRSLSSNDFIRLDEQWYQCKSVGWEAVTPKFVQDIDLKVRQHPLFMTSPWVALDRVMFALNHAVDPFDL